MSQEIEIEFKNILNKVEYDRLLSMFNFPLNPVIQTNYYFETATFSFREQSSALRIREKTSGFKITLKEPYGEGLLETHESITPAELIRCQKNDFVKKAAISKQLKSLNIKEEDLIYFGSLTTERKEFTYKNCLLVLDISTYNGQKDYEFELESPTYKEGEVLFEEILNEANIPIRRTPNKVARFFTTRIKSE